MIFQSINKDHITGALVGVGVCAAGYYMYKKNQTTVDSFLKKQGINVTNNTTKDYYSMSIEELMETKELVEDIIAEKELNTTEEDAITEDRTENNFSTSSTNLEPELV